MTTSQPPPDDLFNVWLQDVERRHLAALTRSEVARALRSLSSCYVERRGKLAAGGALDSGGKRAAFAMYYAPMHFVVVRAIVQVIGADASGRSEIIDLGCGTGVAGAAWALGTGCRRVTGIDRHPWAVAEATWTYRRLRLRGRATRANIGRAVGRSSPRAGIIAAYTVNELDGDTRSQLLATLLDAHDGGARILVIEPIARPIGRWWEDWRVAFERAGGRAEERRFPSPLPEPVRALGRAAGLDPRELAARWLWL